MKATASTASSAAYAITTQIFPRHARRSVHLFFIHVDIAKPPPGTLPALFMQQSFPVYLLIASSISYHTDKYKSSG
jgi:hypothetical protein